ARHIRRGSGDPPELSPVRRVRGSVGADSRRRAAAVRRASSCVTDLRVSRVGLGCNNFGWRLDLEGTRAVVEAALEAGITHFDTAETYGDGNSERFLGELLEGRREDVVIATKFGGRRKAAGSRDYIRRAIQSS